MIHLLSTPKLKRVVLVLASLILSLWHFGPLQGTLPALLLTVGIQVYLLGYLAARALGLWRRSETLVIRITWTAACGLGISIVLGAFVRLLLIPVTAYVIGLHLLMLLLCFIPSVVRPLKPISRQALPFYLLLAGICLLFVLVGWERNKLRFSDYPDQTYPVSLADWWANNPQPESLNSRNIVESNAVTYWSSDGLTYVFAAWAWASGASAAQIIWYVLTPLFVWLVPVAHFATVYRITRRADTAAWATGIVLIFALTTINTPSLLGGAWMWGQEAAFQLTTLRYFSAALLLPLALFVFFSSLRAPHFKNYLMTGIIILALALTHPRQYLVMITGLYAVLGLRWLIKPSKRQFRRVLPVGLAILPSMLVPLWQYSAHLQDQITPDLLSELGGVASIKQQIIEPSMLFFHPFVILALVLSLVAVIRLRRSLAAQYIIATVGVMLLLSYIPPIFNIILRVFGSYFGIHFVFELFFILPIGLILGLAISFGRDWLAKRLHLDSLISNSVIAAGFVAAALVLLIEPFPIVQSARDQIDALNQIQTVRDIRPFDEQLLARLSALPITGSKVVYLTSNRIASYVIESVPHAFVTGGREQGNPAFAGTTRFFDNQHVPWLDADDITFLQKYDVSYIVLSADSSRIPQLILQPERFEQVDSVAGYVIFGVRKPLKSTPLDALFADMNKLYQSNNDPIGLRGDIHWQPASVNPQWQNVLDQWQRQVSQQPQNGLARYGLAFAQVMRGNPSNDLWASLIHPYGERLLAQQGDVTDATNLLYTIFEKTTKEEHVLAARALLSEPFFALLTANQLDSLVATAASDPDTWSNLMEWNHEDELRTRAALLMSAGRWQTAAAWLDRIPEVKLAPRDLVARAAIHLLNGSIDSARVTLEQAVDSDWIEPHKTIYANDWTDAGNSAARMYDALTKPAADETSPGLIAETGSIFIMQPQVTQQGRQLMVAATFADFTPALPPQTISVQVISLDRRTTYGQTVLKIDLAAGSLQPIAIPVDLVRDIPPQTPALVVIKLQYDDTLVYQTVEVQAVLSD